MVPGPRGGGRGRGRFDALAPVLIAAVAGRPAASVAAAAGEEAPGQRGRAGVALATIFLLSAAGNKILLRMLLVPAGASTYLLGMLTNCMYVVAFGVHLLISASRSTLEPGLVASSRFALTGAGGAGGGRLYMALAGLCEAVSFIMMPFFASHLPGSLMPVMSQGLLTFNLLFSFLLLGSRYDKVQLLGVAVVLAGVVVCTYENIFDVDNTTASVIPVGRRAAALWDSLGLFGAYAFIALSLTLKELAFKRFAERPDTPKDETLRTEVVNFSTAIWQGLALALLWPANRLLLARVPTAEYFPAAAASLLGAAPLLACYLAVNLVYTAVTTVVLKRLSAVTILLTNVLNVPLVSLFFCLDLPLLGAAPFRWSFVAGLGIIIAGLLAYNYRSWRAV